MTGSDKHDNAEPMEQKRWVLTPRAAEAVGSNQHSGAEALEQKRLLGVVRQILAGSEPI